VAKSGKGRGFKNLREKSLMGSIPISGIHYMKGMQMSYYKLEATHNIVSAPNKNKYKRTYRYYCSSYENMSIWLRDALDNKGKVTVKEISEAVYVRGTR
jgi:hypothetical protein